MASSFNNVHNPNSLLILNGTFLWLNLWSEKLLLQLLIEIFFYHSLDKIDYQVLRNTFIAAVVGFCNAIGEQCPLQF